jgi:hypothetical protein
MYAQQGQGGFEGQAGPGPAGGNDGNGHSGTDEDVIEGEFREA